MKINKYILVSLFLLLLISPAAAIKPVHANPINIAARLVLDTDSAKIASSLRYYGYTPQPSSSDKTVYTHPDGTTISITYPIECPTRPNGPTSPIPEKEISSRRDDPLVVNPRPQPVGSSNEKSSQAAFPTILVKSKVSQKEINNILKDLNYHKVGGHYETLSTKHSTHITSCTPTKSGLLFQRLKK